MASGCRGRVAVGAGIEPAPSWLTARPLSARVPHNELPDGIEPSRRRYKPRVSPRQRSGSRGPCCTGRQPEVMSLRRETMSTLPAEPARGLEPRSAAYEAAVSPSPPRGHALGRRADRLQTHASANRRDDLLAGSTVGESNAPHLLGRQGPNRSDNGAKERPAGFEPAPSDWQSGVPPRTPRARGGLGGTCPRINGFADRCLSGSDHEAKGDGRNRTCVTLIAISRRLATAHHPNVGHVSLEERGGIEPLPFFTSTPVFGTG